MHVRFSSSFLFFYYTKGGKSGPVKEDSFTEKESALSALGRWKGRNKQRKEMPTQAGASVLRDRVGNPDTWRRYSISNYRVKDFGTAPPKMCHFGM